MKRMYSSSAIWHTIILMALVLICQQAMAVSPTNKSQASPYHHHRNRAGEFLVDTTISYVQAYGYQEHPSVAFDGTNYLVVWQSRGSDPDWHIYGARIDKSGNILDPAGIPIGIAARGQESPRVAFDGTNFFVVWADTRNYDYHIYGARITQAGVVLDSSGFIISNNPDEQYDPSIAFDGNNYLVTWTDPYSGPPPDIFGKRVDQNGIVLDTAVIPICVDSSLQVTSSIAFGDTNYFVVWRDDRNFYQNDIYGTRIDTGGNILDSLGIPICSDTFNQKSPWITFGGTNHLVVWGDERNGSYDDIYGTRINQLGAVLDPDGFPISTASNDQVDPVSAFDGNNFLTIWSDERGGSYYDDIFGTRITQGGIVLDPSGIPISTADEAQEDPAIGFDGTNYLALWTDEREWASDIFGTRINQACTVLDPNGILFSTAANYQYLPSAAFDGSNYLVVWENNYGFSDNRSICGMRVDQMGNPMDPIPILIWTNSRYGNPCVAFDGTNYLVVWRYSDDIYGTRINPSGVILDTSGIIISNAAAYQLHPAISFDGTNYLVVWEEGEDIYGARVNQSGVVLDPAGIPIYVGPERQSNPAIAFSGSFYLIAWEDYRSTWEYDIYASRVDQSGNVLDSAGIAVCTTTYSQQSPSVGSDGVNYLIAWSRYYIYGKRINQSGNILDTNEIQISSAQSGYPCISFDGSNYFIAWMDHSGFNDSDLLGARIDTSGTVIDSFDISLQYGDQQWPSVSRGIGNQMLIVYTGWAGKVDDRRYNTMRIWGKLSSSIGIDEEISKEQMKKIRMTAYPNPFSKRLFISFQGQENIEKAIIEIYDVTGRKQRKITAKNGFFWDGKDNLGNDCPPGIYFIKVNGKFVEKVVKVR